MNSSVLTVFNIQKQDLPYLRFFFTAPKHNKMRLLLLFLSCFFFSGQNLYAQKKPLRIDKDFKIGDKLHLRETIISEVEMALDDERTQQSNTNVTEYEYILEKIHPNGDKALSKYGNGGRYSQV
jgi:hypothetical protein